MISEFLTKLMGGTKSEREVKRLTGLVDAINEQFDKLQDTTQDDLMAKTRQWQERIAKEREELESRLESEDLEEKEVREAVYEAEQNILEEILPEAFAVVKRGAQQMLGQKIQILDQETEWDMVHYDVQLIGGIILHQGKIAEMKTGEGKTLVATLPIYLNALVGKGVHVVTVNDYLAERDSNWMGALLRHVGLTVGVILNSMTPEQRQVEYGKDVTYGTNNEFGFDYLRDNMSITPEEQVHRGYYYAIVDEVDSVLIDEARTPLIISGMVESQISQKFNDLRPSVDSLTRKQMQLVNRLLAEAEVELKNADTEYSAGEKILMARRGAPKHPRLAKLYQEPGIKKLEQRIENDYLRDKRMPELDEKLYYIVEEKQNVVDLMEMGRETLAPGKPETFVIPDLGEALHDIDSDESLSGEEKLKKKEELYGLHGERSDVIHHINQLLKAYSLFEKDVDYVVQDGKVMIVDEFTGRILPGRRYSDGLHQALEAKERVQIEAESQTLATITLQNYFRMYAKLAGMTGTALTESAEFWDIYKLDVIAIPTNEQVIRKDMDDLVYKSRREKYNAVIEEIADSYKKGQPVLVGTISVEVSETLSRMLKRVKIPHNVLNAKHHSREAEIVARAGQKHAVTIATNMAGRGTDIKLGQGVTDLGGLKILGTERHESRRIDLQLRGRAGRQGDPGATQFYLSLEDDLMRLFQSDRVASIMDKLGVQEGEVIQAGMVTRAVERAQKKVEERNFSIRKHLLEYDNVMNQQREIVYDRRNHALLNKNLEEDFREMVENFVDTLVDKYTADRGVDEGWDWDGLNFELGTVAFVQAKPKDYDPNNPESLREGLVDLINQAYKAKAEIVGEENIRRLLQWVNLRITDEKWREHLYEMDQLKEGINLRAVGQKDPLIEYKREGFEMFVNMLDAVDRETLRLFFHARLVEERAPQRRPRARNISQQHADTTGMGLLGGLPQAPGSGAPAQPAAKPQPVQAMPKVGRNDPCPCGSGKKYKKCHGANQ
ncbi:MAG: preprotein translocase subunit SecA [Candidatus Marinimicrobia bacterium]|nr:preprotein translocase subunit SecA [Candidatus Neomarinimicrobiota bacterium]